MKLKIILSSLVIGLVMTFVFLSRNKEIDLIKHDNQHHEITHNDHFHEGHTHDPSNTKQKKVTLKSHNKKIEGDTINFEKVDGDNLFSNSVIGKKLEVHVARLEDIGPNAQQELDERLNELRKNKTEAGRELRSAYLKLDINQFSNRYKIIWTLGQLNDPESKKFISKLAVEPIPDSIPNFQGHGDINRPGLESNIRMAAVRAVAALAQDEDFKEGAQEVLLEAIINANSTSVKKVAIVTYLNNAEDLAEAEAYLKSILPEKDHKLISNKVDDVPDLQ